MALGVQPVVQLGFGHFLPRAVRQPNHLANILPAAAIAAQEKTTLSADGICDRHAELAIRLSDVKEQILKDM